MTTPHSTPTPAETPTLADAIGRYVRRRNIIVHEYPVDQVPLDCRERDAVAEIMAVVAPFIAAANERAERAEKAYRDLDASLIDGGLDP